MFKLPDSNVERGWRVTDPKQDPPPMETPVVTFKNRRPEGEVTCQL